MVKSDILKTPYFVYDSYKWARISLEGRDVLGMLEEIEKGASPFKVVPGFKKNILKFGLMASFPFGRFENSLKKNYDKGEAPEVESIGKLLIPYYNVLTRDDMINYLEDVVGKVNRRRFTRSLSENPNANFFYSISPFKLDPLDFEKVFVLKKEQLE